MLGNCCSEVALPKIETSNPDSKCGIVRQSVGRHQVDHSTVLEGGVEGVPLPLLHRFHIEREESAHVEWS